MWTVLCLRISIGHQATRNRMEQGLSSRLSHSRSDFKMSVLNFDSLLAVQKKHPYKMCVCGAQSHPPPKLRHVCSLSPLATPLGGITGVIGSFHQGHSHYLFISLFTRCPSSIINPWFTFLPTPSKMQMTCQKLYLSWDNSKVDLLMFNSQLFPLSNDL